MRITQASRDALEFPALREVVARFAVSDLGSEAVRSATPFVDSAELERSFAKAREVAGLVESSPLVRRFDDELIPLLARIESERADFEGRDLLLTAQLVVASQAALERIRQADPTPPSLLEETGDVLDLSELATAIQKSLDERGQVRDDASPRLAQLSRRNRRGRASLYERLGSFVAGQRDNLAEETISVHDGRLVLMLRSGAKGRLPGVTQGRSGSGKSFYFEPLEFVEANNELQEGQRDEQAERRRIVAELVERVRSHRQELARHGRLIAELDRLQALYYWKRRIDGEFVIPEGNRSLELVEARHPLIDPLLASERKEALGQAGHVEEVVPLVVRLDENGRMLVVTGPNAGGKTVALKSVGLLTLAAHCGFPIPARSDSSLPFLSALVAVVGDDQDLLEERSTFSGRLHRLKEAWDLAGPQSLLLIDELGSGTDPTEGAALGIALIEALAAKSSWTVVTTHLTAIAAAAIDLDGAACAAMEFDSGTRRPTYRLVAGAPGASEALALARRLGLPTSWLDRAEQLLSPEERRLRRLLEEVERIRAELETERLETSAERARTTRRLEEAEEHLVRSREQEARIEKSLKREFREFRDHVRRELSKELERLAAEARQGRKPKSVAKSVERLFDGAPNWTLPKATRAVEVGDMVEHQGFGWSGRLEKISGKKAWVAAMGKRVTCQLTELVALEEEGAGASVPVPATAHRSAEGLSESLVELVLIGQRVEPALEELERFLDRAILESHDRVRVVHGHGTGRLRAAVRKRLERHRGVATWRPGDPSEGGDGATIVGFVD